MPRHAAALLDVVDIGYASTAETRLTCVLEAARSCFPENVGVAGFRFTRSAGVTPIEIHEDASLRGAVRACFASAEHAIVPAFEELANANIATDVAWQRRGRIPGVLRAALGGLGVENVFGVIARSGGDDGLWLGCGLVGVAHADEPMRRRVSHFRTVARHLSLAMHIDAMRDDGEPAATFDHRGRGDFPAVAPHERDVMRSLARHLDEARDAAASEPSALDAWSLLASGRYTLSRRAEANGSVRFIAYENVSHGPHARALTTSEREVVERVAAGQSNKAIALDLACSEPRVAVLAKRAMTKLGVVHRAELVKLLATLRGAD